MKKMQRTSEDKIEEVIDLFATYRWGAGDPVYTARSALLRYTLTELCAGYYSGYKTKGLFTFHYFMSDVFGVCP